MTISSSIPRHQFDYVEDRSCFRAQCSCLCGTGPCRFCCRFCPPCKESTCTRLVYVTFLIVGVFIMAVFMSEEIQEGIIDVFPQNFSICEWLGAGRSCEAGKLMGYMAVYRIGLAFSLYHLILMMVTFKVKSSKDCRANIHNGMWLYKFMLIAVLCLAVFLIPDKQDYFINIWMYVAMAGAALFIVVQMLLLVFMVHSWTDKMQKRVANGSSSFFWFILVAPCTALLTYIACTLGVILLYINFAAGKGCYRNQWFILINAGACLVISVVAGFKKDTKPWGLRLLHSSLISLYVIYLTWNAISSAPRRFDDGRMGNQPINFGPADVRSRSQFRFSFDEVYYCGPNKNEPTTADNTIPYVSFVITIITVLFGSLGVSESKKCRALELPDCPRSHNGTDHEKDDSGGQIIVRNEKKSLLYNYSLFHLMMSLALLLLMMHLTAWYTPGKASLRSFGRSWAAMWIKMASSWICLLIYFFTILCPSVLPDRRPSVVPIDDEQDVEADAEPHVKVNGYALEREYDEDDVDEEAVPLKPVRRPFHLSHQETTV